MKKIFSVFWREYKSYFLSPIAYVVLIVFILLVANRFIFKFNQFAELTFQAISDSVRMGTMQPKFSINDTVIRYVFQHIRTISMFLLPMITMRLIAEERKLGTVELLLTSPVTILQLVIGKFMAGFTLFLTMVLPTAFFHVYLFKYGNPDLGPIITRLCGYSSVWCLGYRGRVVDSVRSLENQIIAGALTFGAFLFLWIVGRIGDFIVYALGQDWQLSFYYRALQQLCDGSG